MVLLAVETSSSLGSLCLIQFANGEKIKVLASIEWGRGKSQTEIFNETLNSALATAGIKIEGIGALAVGLGPGSFTGVRVGVNAVRALSYSLGIPVIACDSLRILAEPAVKTGEDVLVMVNAFRNLVYWAHYSATADQVQTLVEPRVSTAEDIHINSKSLCVGDGWSLYKSHLPETTVSLISRNEQLRDFPLAENLGRYVASQWSTIVKLNWNQVVPLYLRGSEAEEKLKMGLLKPVKDIFTERK